MKKRSFQFEPPVETTIARRGGIAYEIVANPLPEDRYHARLAWKMGYYRVALERLAAAKRGSVLRFASLKALNSVKAHAKKLGWTLMFAEDGDGLFVQIVDTGSDK